LFVNQCGCNLSFDEVLRAVKDPPVLPSLKTESIVHGHFSTRWVLFFFWSSLLLLLLLRTMTEICFTSSHFSRTNTQQKSTHAGGIASRVTMRPLE
jgi:hypothetical protein